MNEAGQITMPELHGRQIDRYLEMTGQKAASRQAARRTHSPISIIRLLSSAIGTNTEGETFPRTGCIKRSKASKPITSPSMEACG